MSVKADWLLWACALLTPALISGGQVLFRYTGIRVQEQGGGFLRLIVEPFFVSALALYAATTFVWVYVLRHLPLSQAYPFMALSFVLVPLASVLIFHEVLTLRYWIGTAMIIAGMIVINT